MTTLLIIITSLLFFFCVCVKIYYYQDKPIPKFFLIVLILNLILIGLRYYQLMFRNSMETFPFIIPVGLISIFYLLSVIYIKTIIYFYNSPEIKNPVVLVGFFNYPIKVIKMGFLKISSIFLELHNSFEIFILSSFRNFIFFDWMRFFSRYILLQSFEKITIILIFCFSLMLLLSLNFELASNQLFWSLIYLFFFKLFYRLLISFFFLFVCLNKFCLTFLGKEYHENFDDYFYKWKFINSGFIGAKRANSKFILFFTRWQNYKRFSLFLKSLNDYKIKVDCFISLLFILFLIRSLSFSIFFFDFLILSLFFCLIFQSLLFLNTPNKDTEEYQNFLKSFDSWANKNTVVLWYVSNDPFISSFVKRIKSLFVSRYLFVHFLPTRRRISYRFFNYDPSIIDFLYDIRAIFILVFCFFVYFLFFYFNFNSVTLFFLANFAYFRDLLWMITYFWYNFIFFEPFFFNLDFPKIIFFGILTKDIVKMTFLILLSFFK